MIIPHSHAKRLSQSLLLLVLVLVTYQAQLTNPQPQPIVTLDADLNEQPLQRNQVFPNFSDYVHQFNKQYANNATEYQKRKLIYQDNLREFSEWNHNLSNTHVKGVNQFADLTASEINELSRPLLSLRNTVDNNTPLPPIPSVNLKLGATATSYDWRTLDAVTAIKDQGTCGSCWSFTTIAYLESRMIIKKLATKQIDLSQQYLLECTKFSDCTGGFLIYAADVAALGVPTEAQYPYTPTKTNPGICSTKQLLTSNDKKGYTYTDLSDDSIIAFLTQGPVTSAVSSTGWQSYSGGIVACSNGAVVNHAILIVGYTPTYWIIKNSWGTAWGESGYMKINRARTEKYSNCFIGKEVVVMSGMTYAVSGIILLISAILSFAL